MCVSVFFFSSRRRHTRYWRDWSSDVCSSDLDGKIKNPNTHLTLEAYSQFKEASYTLESRSIRKSLMAMVEADKDSMTADYRARSYYLRDGAFLWFDRSGFDQIGRASCRERV